MDLKKLIKNSGHTVKWLAQTLGVNYSTFQGYLTNGNMPKPLKFRLIERLQGNTGTINRELEKLHKFKQYITELDDYLSDVNTTYNVQATTFTALSPLLEEAVEKLVAAEKTLKKRLRDKLDASQG